MSTPAERTAALSRAIHDDYLTLGGLSDVPQCEECQTLSGLLTGLVRMARELPTKAEYIEALVAEAAETLGLVEPEPNGLLAALGGAVEQEREARRPATTESMADHTTTTRISLMGTAR